MVLDNIPFQLDADALFARLHLDPAGGYAAAILDVARRVAAVARPKALYREAFIEARSPETVTVGNVVFTSRVLSHNLEDVHRVFPYIATCGAEMDAVPIDPGDFIGQFCRDTVKEMALGAAVSALKAHLTALYALGKTSAMHPGSGPMALWPIQQQRELFSLLGDVEGSIGVQLTPTYLMLPNKTVSGILYPTEVDFLSCQLCRREGCPNRGADFDAALWAQRMASAPSVPP